MWSMRSIGLSRRRMQKGGNPGLDHQIDRKERSRAKAEEGIWHLWVRRPVLQRSETNRSVERLGKER
jgi:hypothetical protein